MKIKWNKELFGVEIENNGNHFVINALPSMVMNWHDAVRFYKDSKVWKLPTGEQLLLFAKYINEVNALIKANGGYVIFGWHWTTKEYNELGVWIVDMSGRNTFSDSKYANHYVRAVSNL